MKYFSLFILSFFVFFLSCNDKNKIIEPPTDLQCEYLSDPLGIDVILPRLSWKLSPNGSFSKQKAYQILVADNPDDLENNTGNLWDTKKVESDQSTQLKYKGKPLKSRQKVFWKLRVWDQDNKISDWSKVAVWEMALLQQSDWKAKWIGAGEQEEIKYKQKNPTSYFRKEFTVNNDIQNARAYISAIGYYELYINGKKVGGHVLSPNQSNYDKRNEADFDDKRIGHLGIPKPI